VVPLTWPRVRAWRLARHHLLKAAPRARLTEVVADLGGVHAQIMSSAELALWARVKGLRPEDVRTALWERRELVKTWCMRGTLHLLPAFEYPLWVGALRARRHWEKAYWLRAFDMTARRMSRLLDAVGEVLSDEPLTREELADAVAGRAGSWARERLRGGWGTLLKPAATEGLLCFGPNRGRNVTFVRPDRWIGHGEAIDTDEAMRQIARRYLRTYGPSTHEDFSVWWGWDPPKARALFAELREEIEEVDVEGRRSWVLAGDADRVASLRSVRSTRLLPAFDPYEVGFRPKVGFVDDADAGRVYRPQAWMSPVVASAGKAVGVWKHQVKRARVALTVRPFGSLTSTLRRSVEREAASLGSFLGAPADLTVERASSRRGG
jgi:uncharacterized protein YcaQ